MIPTNTHMTSINPLPWLLILVIGLLITGGIKAHTIDVLEETFTTFAVNQNVTIADAVGYDPTTRAAQVDTTLWVRHKVELFFNTEVLPAADAGKDFKCTVVVEITKRFDSSVSAETPFQKTLTAYYDKNLGVVFDGESAYFFEDIKYRVRYKIISIAYEVDGSSVGSVTTGLFGLRGVMMIDRVWKMSLTSYMTLESPSYSGSLMRLTSSWTAYQGAEEYDFEWTFYDTLSQVQADYDANATYTDFEGLFRDNVSRMTVNTNNVRIRAVYPLGGVFFFRVRPVRYGKQGEREVGRWSSEAYSSIGLGTFVNTHYHGYKKVGGLEEELNWQATINFAEEGKLHYGVNYFDGSLRARQNVMLENTTGIAIVGETIYDYHGRPGIQVIPAPDSTQTLAFKSRENTFGGTTAYSYLNFDTSGVCALIPDTMSLLYGSSRYFSPNTNAIGVDRDYLPDAKQYPFAETEYTPDMTGRIMRQGGVGLTFQIGTDGKYTKYFYGKPDQKELDRIFGIQAGDADHYLKNMVQDPNGQVAVSYVDAHGRTVATALAGTPPPNLIALNSDTATTLEQLMIEDVVDGSAVVSTYSLTVSNDGDHLYSYIVHPTQFTDSCTGGEQCYTCEYDVEIRITDLCGAVLAEVNMSSYSAADTLLTCAAIPAMVWDSTIAALPLGEYHITKTLRVSEAAAKKYAELFLEEQTCVTLQEVEVDTSGCVIDCADCLEELGSFEAFSEHYVSGLDSLGITEVPDSLELIGLYNSAKAECDTLCYVPNQCEMLYLAMLSDVSPGGQYATFEYDEDTGIYSVSDINSLLYNEGYQFLPTGVVYEDENGDTAVVMIDSVAYDPRELGLADFILYFKPSWAKALVTDHPEYCYYEACVELQNCVEEVLDCEEFETLMLETETFGEAQSLGLLILDNDCLLKCLDEEAEIRDYLADIDGDASEEVIDVWELIAGTLLCDSLRCDLDTSDMCEGELDLAWLMYRAIYMGKRAKLMGDYYSTIEDCPVTELMDGKIKRFLIPEVDFSFMESDMAMEDAMADSTAAAEQGILDHCTLTCETNADHWMAALAGCGLDEADSIAMRLRFIQVCLDGCDASHPYGSTTCVDCTTLDTSFIQIFNDYVSGDDCDPNCSIYHINFPGTYEAPQYIGPGVSIGELDTCICENFAQMRECYNDSSPADTSFAAFAAYLQSFTDYDVAVADLQLLYYNCASECKVVARHITIPAILQCEACVPYEEFSSLLTGYLTNCDVDYIEISEDVELGELLADYLNWHLGLNLEFEDYDYHRLIYNDSTSEALQACYRICPKTYQVSTALSCGQQLIADAQAQAQQAYSAQLEALKQRFINTYFSNCLSGVADTLAMTTPFQLYHYTLYYYDQAGNLTRTVPPAGVAFLTGPQITEVGAYRDYHYTGTPPVVLEPSHTMATNYTYNSLNAVRVQQTPDDGIDKHWYDRLGRPVISQSARQQAASPKLYSYTIYDYKGRITEAGEISSTTLPDTTGGGFIEQTDVDAFIAAAGTRAQVTRSYYEASPFYMTIDPLFGTQGQENLRNRIAVMTYTETYGVDTVYDFATHYSYDVLGNVKTLVQDIKELASRNNRYKRIDYEYDLQSGKVNRVIYQKDSVDQYMYVYEYDADNRLSETTTGPNEMFMKTESVQSYYDHGPLFRTQLGEERVQGMDYAYTLQGWIKGVNGSGLNAAKDIGRDGYISGGNTNQTVARDAFGFTLNYFNGTYDGGTTLYHDGDYTPVTPATATFAAAVTGTGGAFDTHSKDLFNGNIRHNTLQLKGVDTVPVAYGYRYDQLQRLKEMNFFNASINASTYSLNNVTTASGDYHEAYTYDGNGNILTLDRRGYLSSGQDEMDSLVYFYDSGKNRLNYIRDTVPAGNYSVDLDSQTPNNYSYDESGNLLSDAKEKLSAVTWSPYRKIKNIAKSLDTVNIAYSYDASMNRVVKKYTSASDTIKTYYIRDGLGNVLAVYELKHDSLRWSEQHLFGSTRLGLIEKNILINSATVNVNKPGTPGLVLGIKRNERRYELSNHLGNVLSVISDVKRPKTESSNTYYDVDRIAVNDYYPFGMQMPGRKQSLDTYRYGFNGKENDNEVKGEGNQQDYGMRIYDPRVGRFLSVDPISEQYPELTPYQFSGNMPIWAIDLDGLEPDLANVKLFLEGLKKPYVSTFESIANSIQNAVEGSIKMIRGYIPLMPPTDLSYEGMKQISDATPFGGIPMTIEGWHGLGEALMADSEELYWKAIDGDSETWGMIAGELSLLLLPGVEGRYTSKLRE